MSGGEDTIAAIATAEGPAGVAVIRISGPEAWPVAEGVLGGAGALAGREAGTFFHRVICEPVTGERLDDGLVLLFRSPASYTGEDAVEIQGHGGVAAPHRVLRAVLKAGARLAEPGEFTKRAFLNGKLELTQAEAVMDLIGARSERAASAARAQLDGALGRELLEVYDAATNLGADLEAQLDFESGELPDRVAADAQARLSEVRGRIETFLATARSGHLLRHGALVVIAGCPNAGKSSLLNALLGKNRAIVSPEAGTTRDTIEEGIELNGIPVRLMDTAGLRETTCPIEQEGAKRTRNALALADVVVFLVDSSRPLSEQHPILFAQALAKMADRLVIVMSKSDLPAQVSIEQVATWHRTLFQATKDVSVVTLSVQDGKGLMDLTARLMEALNERHEAASVPIAERHREKLTLAAKALDDADAFIRLGDAHLLLAADRVRVAAEAVGRVVGRHYDQDLMDQVFGRFCIGK